MKQKQLFFKFAYILVENEQLPTNIEKFAKADL